MVARDDFPRRGRIDYVSGQIEIDMSPEDLFMHSTPKTEIAMGIYARVKQMETGGEVFVDRTRITCPTADLSVEPDIVYISHQTLDSEKIKLVPKASEEPDRYIEIEGPPDLVVEIVSDSSEGKDTRRLPTAYFFGRSARIVAGRCPNKELAIRNLPAGTQSIYSCRQEGRFSAICSAWMQLSINSSTRSCRLAEIRTSRTAVNVALSK